MLKKSFTTTALFAAITAGLAATVLTPVIAAEPQAKTAENTTQQKQASQDFIKVSDDALMTMRNVDGARLAIFEGSPDQAQVYTDAAVTRATAALKDADKYAMDIKASKEDGQKYVPFNADMTVAETLEPTQGKPVHTTKANNRLQKSDSQQAMETLKVDGVNVAFTTEFLPIQSARARIKVASELIGEGKYYEANLALKAVEDSVVTEVLDTNGVRMNGQQVKQS